MTYLFGKLRKKYRFLFSNYTKLYETRHCFCATKSRAPFVNNVRNIYIRNTNKKETTKIKSRNDTYLIQFNRRLVCGGDANIRYILYDNVYHYCRSC